MAVIRGCQEGKYTPKIVNIKCPKCGAVMEVFVRMGGEVGMAGTLVSDETCDKCGYVVKEGTPVDQLEQVQ
jgi:uncharacterized Zn finger protein